MYQCRVIHRSRTVMTVCTPPAVQLPSTPVSSFISTYTLVVCNSVSDKWGYVVQVVFIIAFFPAFWDQSHVLYHDESALTGRITFGIAPI